MGEEWRATEPGIMVPVSEAQKKFEQDLKDAPELDFEVSGETWITIDVVDGAEVRFRTIILGVKRLPDKPNGDPQYVIKTQNHMRVVKKASKEGENLGSFLRRR